MFFITREQLDGYVYFEKPVSLSEIVARINELVDLEAIKKLSYRDVSDWLISIDALKQETDPQGRMHKKPTEKGLALGITSATRVGEYGPYPVVIYDRYAQEFIIDNMEAILTFISKK